MQRSWIGFVDAYFGVSHTKGRIRGCPCEMDDIQLCRFGHGTWGFVVGYGVHREYMNSTTPTGGTVDPSKGERLNSSNPEVAKYGRERSSAVCMTS